MALDIQRTTNIAVLAKKLARLERLGKYEQAIGELAHVWPDVEQAPNIEDLARRDAAEILLRCGGLLGFYGHTAQIPDAQLRSKDLLTNALQRFLDLNEVEKAAECENYIALALWRTGEYEEAGIWVESSLSRDLPTSSHTRLYSFIAKSMLDETCKRNEENIQNLKKREFDFLNCDNAFLIGSFYTNLALSEKRVGAKSDAVGHFELARLYHQRSGHKIYLGTVENNLANLYKDAGKFARAHEAIDNATRVFRNLKDKTREGFSLDTKAMVFFAEAKYDDALSTVEKACTILEKSENFGYLVETFLTKAKVLLFLDNFSEAILSLIEAVNIARVQSGESAAKDLINQFETALYSRNASPKNSIEEKDLELVLPRSIANFDGYQGVWISNCHLEEIGLPKGSLAIVADVKVERGDLAAVSELASGEVSCGFYDAAFGIVSLEGTGGEPQIFSEHEVSLLGKIVGVCASGKNAEGKMVVESLNI